MNSESKCIHNWLHNYQIVGQHPEGVLEMCVRCKKRLFFKVVAGRIDNYRYVKHHNRQLLQKQNAYFPHEFPNRPK